MQSDAKTVEEYLESLPADRKKALSELRDLIRKHLPEGYEEGMQYGMIGYSIPLERYPNTYNNQPLLSIALASHKNYISLYLMSCYAGDAESNWFRKA